MPKRKQTSPGDIRPPLGEGSALPDESPDMERKRRLIEQDGERPFGRVKAREHRENNVNQEPGEDFNNDILQHPELNNQSMDGIDPNVSPLPPQNTEARREYDELRNEQELKKKMALGLIPNLNTTPKPGFLS